ncbi:ATP-binding cassette domain-containing protein [Streptomyces sp. MAR25Y5]|uniref:ATP-binding cassette domain-containing protein n=1 Tax=Streptomyces sp. MAR25Y5 TaxID=2962028 RepID=UPI0027E55517|nr:ATP-binding cassette domain-containing protein [Streptomyces sp. MAR25Y5]
MNLRFNDVTQHYGRNQVLHGVNFELGQGVIGLLGPNGAGKSTLMRTMATVMPPRGGCVEINGTPVTDERIARQARSQIGYLPQEFGYDPGMRVIDFVEYAAWLRGISGSRLQQVTEKALETVDLTEKTGVRMSKLSGGQRRRAGIAWAIVGDPSIIILDEPTVGLDPEQRIHFRSILKTIRNATVVLSTHLTDDVEAVCDRVLVLNAGKITYDGGVPELAARGHAGLPGETALERAYMDLLPRAERSA